MFVFLPDTQVTATPGEGWGREGPMAYDQTRHHNMVLR